MQTTISIPDHLFHSAEKLAGRLGVSLSELYAMALAAMVEKYNEEFVTSRLNDIYGDNGEESSLDPEVAKLQNHSLA